MAETSDVFINHGHCYLEFIEKDPQTHETRAKARAHIWSNTFQRLRPYFEQETGQAFISGIHILVKASVDFHPIYGLSLNIYDIEPSYTLGEIQRNRREILTQLEQEGALLLNKELKMPPLPQRIAVISSPTAAGYGDFLGHLTNNASGLVFYPCLFQAVMQGEQTESSLIAALSAIHDCREQFDVVVIIRGGGASSDLVSFDTYNLASHCAQFPLPIITGIGHDRDETVLDYIAHHRAKTPTAAADYLIDRLKHTANELQLCEIKTIDAVSRILSQADRQVRQMEFYIPAAIKKDLDKCTIRLLALQQGLAKGQKQFIANEESKLRAKDAFFKLSSPQYILSKGYSITTKNGKIVKSSRALAKGDTIETRFSKGKISSIIT
jgi:exodeoxyribonuclease VII large subunit